jgi:SAM-dependent methyltransferase
MKYRERVYKHYSSARVESLVPKTVEEFKPREPFFNKIIKNNFPLDKNINILELGCGHGIFQYFINKAGYKNSKGIDGSIQQVEGAKKLGIKNIILGDMIAYIKVLDSSFLDMIIAIDIFEHFTKEEFTDLVDELHRILKKDGLIICHQPNSEGPFGNFMRDWDYTHELSFTRQSLAQIFLASEFNSIKTFEDKPIIHGVKSFFRFVLWEYLIRNIFVAIRTIESGRCDKEAIFTQNFLAVIKK